MAKHAGVIAAIAAGILLVLPVPATAQDAVGAGSSFIGPAMKRWTAMAASQASLSVTYDPVGSSRGQSKILAREVDFGASDSPMSEETRANANLLQFPVVIGAVVCVVNVPGIATDQLRLNGPLLADIYTGKIKNWNDPKIAEINPGLKLPDMDIRPVSQTNLAGTTFVYTQYLLSTNAEWREKFGPAITKRWAIGSAVGSNTLMMETLKTLPGSIGYTDYGSAIANKYAAVLLQNKAGKYVTASPAHFSAGVDTAEWTKSPDLVVNLINQPGDNAWPILTASYVQIPVDPQDPSRAQAVRKFFDFAFTKGGQAATEAQFIPLPTPAQAAVRAMWNKTGS